MYWLLGKAMLVILGAWWCKEIFARLGSDISRMKESENRSEKGVIVFYWLLTLWIIGLMGYFVYGLFAPIIAEF